MNVFAILILFSAILTISWTAHLSTNSDRKLYAIYYYHNNQSQQQEYNSISYKQSKRHKTYDKSYDIAEIGDSHLLSEHGNKTSLSSKRRERRQLSNWLIAPNTRWCGRGNTANGTYNHLGGASSADKCCRKHDHCQLFIPGMSNRFELFNYRPYTLSHCNCDRRFRTCLKMANDEDAKTIGKLFFNVVQTQCFILKTEHVCQQRSADDTCERELVRQKAYLRNNKKF